MRRLHRRLSPCVARPRARPRRVLPPPHASSRPLHGVRAMPPRLCLSGRGPSGRRTACLPRRAPCGSRRAAARLVGRCGPGPGRGALPAGICRVRRPVRCRGAACRAYGGPAARGVRRLHRVEVPAELYGRCLCRAARRLGKGCLRGYALPDSLAAPAGCAAPRRGADGTRRFLLPRGPLGAAVELLCAAHGAHVRDNPPRGVAQQVPRGGRSGRDAEIAGRQAQGRGIRHRGRHGGPRALRGVSAPCRPLPGATPTG